MEGVCGHTVAEHRNSGSAEFTALKKKKEFKSGDAQEDFKRILIDDVGSRPSSELIEDLTLRSRLCIREKKPHYSEEDYCCVTCRSRYFRLSLHALMQEMQIFPAL